MGAGLGIDALIGPDLEGNRPGMLHPEAERYLADVAAWAAANGIASWPELGARRAREVFRDARVAMRPPLPEVDLAEDRRIEARSGPLKVRVIRPKGAGASRLPLIVYFHGGGYVVGGIDESEDEARRLAMTTPAVVISASYRLAPDDPFPAAVDDAYDAFLWASHRAGELDADPRRLVVAGTSAGGGLAAAVAHLAAVENGPRIAGMLLLCPWLDLTLKRPSVSEFAIGYGLDRSELVWYAESYLGNEGAADHPLVSPLLHPIPARLPPAVILAAECDPLRDDARDFAAALRKTGVDVDLTVAPGMVHAFNVLTHFMPAGRAYLRPVEEALQRLLTRG